MCVWAFVLFGDRCGGVFCLETDAWVGDGTVISAAQPLGCEQQDVHWVLVQSRG